MPPPPCDDSSRPWARTQKSGNGRGAYWCLRYELRRYMKGKRFRTELKSTETFGTTIEPVLGLGTWQKSKKLAFVDHFVFLGTYVTNRISRTHYHRTVYCLCGPACCYAARNENFTGDLSFRTCATPAGRRYSAIYVPTTRVNNNETAAELPTQ